ncbi:MAG: hypothetical protein J2P13_09245 [Acidobacteria bacterium]|nr:hypothetical protein [Acidobacteriota bacterium]
MADSTQISEPNSPVSETASAQDRAKADLWIFREGRRELSGRKFLAELRSQLSAKTALTDALIQAGELEAALADLDAPGAEAAAALTDQLARELSSGIANGDADELANRIEVPPVVSIAPPEGFTYYALHPLDFARSLNELPLEAPAFAVIGIRSIGTTLSAVMAAALGSLGKSVKRVTVRPTGHPYSRICPLSGKLKSWISKHDSLAAHFLVVDEGPGRSGSTFLSVAEALRDLGVRRERITIVGSRPFDPGSLCAEDAVARWSQFRFVATPSSLHERFPNWTYIAGGDWRGHFFHHESEWPESWTQMERWKVLSPDQGRLVKFEGMGRIGRDTRERAFALASAGFSPDVQDAGDGFLSYTAVQGRRVAKTDMASTLLEQIARYCAFRASEFTAQEATGTELEQMVAFNVREEFGRELDFKRRQLSTERPVVVDGRMQPYEWVAASGKALKIDAISHGDNHFFPGPCDIAWDIAGTIVEWDLGQNASRFLIEKFRKFSGVDLSETLMFYLLAYCVFRLGFCKMARSTVVGSREEERLDLAYRHYRDMAARLVDVIPSV